MLGVQNSGCPELALKKICERKVGGYIQLRNTTSYVKDIIEPHAAKLGIDQEILNLMLEGI